MIDVKKLVTGFLVLAVAVSASAFLISFSSNGAAGASGATAAVDGTDGTALASNAAVSGNAFLPENTTPNADLTDDQNVNGNTPIPSSTEAIIDDPNNLTNIFANAYINNLALANEDGPATDANGNPTLTAPDDTSVINEFVGSSTAASVTIPDWDAEADQVPVQIVSSTPAALASYGGSLNDILNDDIVTPGLQTMLADNSDPSAVTYSAGKITAALQDIAGLQTPASAVALQKSLIKTLVYAKDSLALAEGANTDPLKTEIILEAEGDKYDAAVQDLQTQMQQAESQNLFSDAAPGPQPTSGGGVFADIQSIIGVPVAHAQLAYPIPLPVLTPAADVGIWATVAQMVKNEVKDVVLQIIKNTIVFLMQKVIFSKIRGSGAPAFIQQWGLTIANAFQQGALNALNSQMACVGAAPFAPQLRLTLGATYKPSQNVCAVSFQGQLGNNLQSSYNNFSSGGWVTYGATMQPDYNYYGSLFFTAQAVGNTAQSAQSAAQAKSIANQGFHGSAVCNDGSDPNGVHLLCTDPTTGYPVGSLNGSSCPAGFTPDYVPNNGTCANGTEPMTQTPGAIFNGMVNSAVNGNFSLVTSANSWAGLASGLFVSIMQQVLNSLATTVISDANGLLQQAANGGGATTSGSPSSLSYTIGASSTPEAFSCLPPIATNDGNPFTFQLQATGGETVTATGISTPSYVWPTPPAGVKLSTTIGDTVIATFNATGTYQIPVQDVTDNLTTTCQVTVTGSDTN